MTSPRKLGADTTDVSDLGFSSLVQWQREIPRSASRHAERLRAIDVRRAVVEQAKGALMLHYGIDSHQAFAVLVRWSAATNTAVPVLADVLVSGVYQGSQKAEEQHQSLVRWLEEQLRRGDPDPGAPPLTLCDPPPSGA